MFKKRMGFMGLLLILFLAGARPVLAQPLKIGYTNIELIVGLMPEAKQMQGALATHERKLMEQINIKKQYFESLVSEFREKKERGEFKPEEEQKKIEEIQRLESEIQKFVEDSERSFNKKKEEMLEPILEKLQKTIDEVATENGLTYVFNSGISGSSIILKGPKSDNITLKVLDKLRIEVPAEMREQLTKNTD
jgi:outer membrane protein